MPWREDRDAIVPEKLQEEEKIEFKQRQRRRSSVPVVALPKVIGAHRRASTVSTESWCMYYNYIMSVSYMAYNYIDLPLVILLICYLIDL